MDKPNIEDKHSEPDKHFLVVGKQGSFVIPMKHLSEAMQGLKQSIDAAEQEQNSES